MVNMDDILQRIKALGEFKYATGFNTTGLSIEERCTRLEHELYRIDSHFAEVQSVSIEMTERIVNHYLQIKEELFSVAFWVPMIICLMHVPIAMLWRGDRQRKRIVYGFLTLVTFICNSLIQVESVLLEFQAHLVKSTSKLLFTYYIILFVSTLPNDE